MRFILSWHIHETELRERSPAWREEAAAFLARFEDELFVNSELDWVEVLDPESHAIVVGPGGEVRKGFITKAENHRPGCGPFGWLAVNGR